MQRIVVQNRVTAQLDFCHSLVSAFWYREEERGGEGRGVLFLKQRPVIQARLQPGVVKHLTSHSHTIPPKMLVRRLLGGSHPGKFLHIRPDLNTYFWFSQSFNSIHDVIISCARRSLSYPLYRHWSLITAVVEDTKKIFSLGM